LAKNANLTEGAMLDTDGIMKGSRKMVIIARAHSIGSYIAHHSVLLSLKKEKKSRTPRQTSTIPAIISALSLHFSRLANLSLR